MVSLSQIRRSSERIRDGAWVGAPEQPIPDMGDLRLLVKGVSSEAWRKIQYDAERRAARFGMAFDRHDELREEQLKAVLLGWENLELTPGVVLPHSKEAATILIEHPDFEVFRAAVFWSAANVGNVRSTDGMGDVFDKLKPPADPANQAGTKPRRGGKTSSAGATSASP